MKKEKVKKTIENISSRKRKIIKNIILPFLGLMFLFLIFLGIYSLIFANNFYHNQYLAGENLSGKNKTEATKLINQKTEKYLKNKITLAYQKSGQKDVNYEIDPSEISLKFDVDKNINAAWNYGHGNGALKDFWQQLCSLFIKNNANLSYSLDQDILKQKASTIATETDTPEKDYSLVYSNGKFILSTNREDGQKIDQARLIKDINNQVAEANIQKINFSTKSFKPKITEENAQVALKQANNAIEAGDLTLEHSDQKFIANADTMASFIEGKVIGDNLEIIFDEDKINAFIKSIAESIDTLSKNTKLTVVNGQVTIAESSQNGQILDQTSVKKSIENVLLARMKKTISKNIDLSNITLKVDQKVPEVSDSTIATLGVTELVGTGITNFAGSSDNRIRNIQLGAAAINGTLLKPGEEFSTLKKIGKIDASTGFLPELVIKNNQTVPDYGGGLCQVSTTLFRAALNAGLKITERQNHSYRVSYYEPPVGMDATIFDPSPDFKFVNNYGRYILIQSRIEGKKITFDIYGAKDSRQVTITDPVVSNVIDPPAAAYIETDTLPAGQQQIVSKAHQGQTVVFDYTVTRDGQILQQKAFKSVYVPWQEKILVGIGN